MSKTAYLLLLISVTLEIICFNTCKCSIENYSHNLSIEINKIEQHANNTSFFAKDPEQGLLDALIYYEIECPEIVYSQAILESGLGRSKVYNRTNNLFGLYNSRIKDYHYFDHWTQSVIGYKNMIQNRYQNNEDYYMFLKRIRYAEDENYINKLKNIVDTIK